MKKTLFLSAAAAVLALAGTSCSSENDQPMPGNGNNVSFRVSIHKSEAYPRNINAS